MQEPGDAASGFPGECVDTAVAGRRLDPLPRGGEHHQVLDSYEGVAAADSTIASQLGQITCQIAEHKDQAGYAGTAAKLRVAASVSDEASY